MNLPDDATAEGIYYTDGDGRSVGWAARFACPSAGIDKQFCTDRYGREFYATEADARGAAIDRLLDTLPQ